MNRKLEAYATEVPNQKSKLDAALVFRQYSVLGFGQRSRTRKSSGVCGSPKCCHSGYTRILSLDVRTNALEAQVAFDLARFLAEPA